MFQSLQDRLSGVLDKLTRRGALTESDVVEAMREVTVLRVDSFINRAEIGGEIAWLALY